MKYDALGNEVVIGKYYGYTTDNSGITTSAFGEAIKETKNGVSIKIKQKRKGLWQDMAKVEKSAEGTTVNVKSMKLWPVAIEQFTITI